MNPEIKAEWLEALRSGKYQQSTLYLRRTDNTFCCFGVLCDIVGAEWVLKIDRYQVRYKGNYHHSELPHNLQQELDILSVEHCTLVKMNDSGHSFSEIADWIEENL